MLPYAKLKLLKTIRLFELQKSQSCVEYDGILVFNYKLLRKSSAIQINLLLKMYIIQIKNYKAICT